MKHIKGLDTLRAFAVIFVIIEHWWLPIDISGNEQLIYWIKGLVPDSGFGVELFFVLSGFLITNILLNALDGTTHTKLFIIKNFMIRRALRIFPIYYLTIFVLMLIKYPFIQDNLSYFILYISNIQVYQTREFNAFSHTWSLSVEEQFYLIWPWFIVFVKENYLKFVFVGAIVIGALTAFYSIIILKNWAGGLLMPSCMQAFGIGGFYAYLRDKGRLSYYTKFMEFALPAALTFHFYWAFNYDAPSRSNYCFLAVNSIIAIWVIDRVIYNRSTWVKNYLLENRILNKIGQISYGIYLFHYTIPFIYEKIIRTVFSSGTVIEIALLDWKNAYFIKLALLFLLALASFHFIEKPILKLKNRFTY